MAIAIAISACQSLQLPRKPLASTPVTIKLSGWGGSPVEQKLLRQVLQDFEAQHPTIKAME